MTDDRTQPEALILANSLERIRYEVCDEASAELRRLHAENERLKADLRDICSVDPVDAMLDPQRAVRIARAALGRNE